jgi:phosphoglucosamine mutase
MTQQKISLKELKKIFTPYPQELINIDVAQKIPFDEMPSLKASLKKLEAELDNVGQLLVRYSGTEAKARVFVQAPNADTAKHIAELAADAVRKEIEAKTKQSSK